MTGRRGAATGGLTLLTSVLALACSPDALFQCTEDSQCVQDGVDGFCEATGACSFPDATCPSNRRYGRLGGALADRCVPEDEGTGSATGSSTTGADAAGSSSTSDGSSTGGGSTGEGSTSTGASETTQACGGLGLPCCNGVCDLGQVCDDDVCSPCALDVQANEYFTCGQRSDGTLGCWGTDAVGQLGDGPEPNPGGATLPVRVDLEAGLLRLGAFHACGSSADGLSCWGGNEYGQVGVGGSFDTLSPAQVGVGNVSALAAGGWHTLAVTEDGELYCWGRNDRGQCLAGGDESYGVPTSIEPPLPNIEEVAAGALFSCARSTDGEVWCWGSNSNGELGTDGGSIGAPGAVPGLPPLISLAVGDFHACGLSADDGSVWCWGRSNLGQTGDVSRLAIPYAAHIVSGLPPMQGLAVGDDHSCAWSDAELYCWGTNASGQLGVDVPGGPLPQLVDIETVTAMSMGREHTCAVTQTPEILCWGGNAVGQLGNGGRGSGPTAVPAAFGCDTALD